MDTILGINAIAFWIVATGALVGISGGILGSFLVLRRMSMIADAISHSVLPGIALAFALTGSRAPIPILLGALFAGLVTVALTEAIRRYAKVGEDAAIGVVFTTMFALGVVMVSRFSANVDLDTDCILSGVLETAALETVNVMGLDIPSITLNMAILTLVIVSIVFLLWKELKLVAFDPDLAKTLGFRPKFVNAILMFLVAAFSVMAFEAVGTILVVAMLIVPATAAYMLTNRLSIMVILAVAIGISSAFLGRHAAFLLDTTVAGMIAVATGIHLVLAVFFGPEHGYLARKIANARLAVQTNIEDLLAMIVRTRGTDGACSLPLETAHKAFGGGLRARGVIIGARFMRLVEVKGIAIKPTREGARKGMEQLRKHRLWETWLAERCGLPADHVHEPAHRMEHFIDENLADMVADDLGRPTVDPHGREIV